MTIIRPKVPREFRGLIRVRARIAGTVATAQTLGATPAGLQAAELDLEAVDRLLTRYCPGVDPTTIKPRRTNGRHSGPRGGLRDAVEAVLRAAAPHALTALDLAHSLQARLSIHFETDADRTRWVNRSVRNQLGQFVRQRLAERLTIQGADGKRHAAWRLPVRAADDNLQALTESIEAAGLAVRDDC